LSWAEPLAEEQNENYPVLVRRALCWAHLGRTADAREVLVALVSGPIGEQQDAANASLLVTMLQLAVSVEEHQAAAKLVSWLEPVTAYYQPFVGVMVGRIAGEAAVMLHMRSKAYQYYHQAQAMAERVQHRPELALIALDLAELDAAEGHSDAAREHLAFCIPELEDMKMRPALEKALALQLTLS
jgi:hypothetical protein